MSEIDDDQDLDAPVGSRRERMAPHRGAAVLVLGILGFVVCFVCGIVAWSMGDTDLRAMREGRMDPSGEGMTNAGRILGMVCTILAIISVVIVLIVLVFGAFGR